MTDVLIIGGGLAGAAAALWLADLGRSSLVVEARSRLGGRAHSRDWGNSGGPVEYGGGWIRADHDQMIGLTQRLGIRLVPTAEITGHSYFRDGVWRADPAEDMATHESAMANFLADASEMAEDTAVSRMIHGMTLQNYLDYRAYPASVRREMMAWWSISGSAAPDVVGADEYVTTKLAKGLMIKLEELAFTAETGVASIAQRAIAASGAGTVLGDAVERVEDLGGRVRATLASGRVVEAATALVALPVNALSQIRFVPSLSPAQNSLRRSGHAGRALKLLIRAKGPQPGHLATGETLGIRWIYADRILPDGTTLLIAFGLADDIGEPDLATVETVLKAAFPGAELAGFDWHDWTQDPFARGTWVSPIKASQDDYAPEHWGLSGRLAFAGSDLYSAEQGWMEGALLTARAAVAALETCLQQDL